MSNQGDRFLGGFLAGSIFGGIVGGLIGSYLVTKLDDSMLDDDEENDRTLEGTLKSARNLLRRGHELGIEDTRQGLEDKIAALNEEIDQARKQLNYVNEVSSEDG